MSRSSGGVLLPPPSGGGAILGGKRLPFGRPAPPGATVFKDIQSVPAGSVQFNYETALAAVVDAQAEAERIVQEARDEAARLGAEAQRNAEVVHAHAYTKGYAEGVAQARDEAEAAADARAEEHVAALRADVAAFCEALVAEQARAWGAAERELRALALEIAERVIRAEVSVNPQVVLKITKQCLRRLEGEPNVRIRVNPAEVERLREHRDELLAMFEGLRNVEITEDRRVGIGGVQIETDAETVDARIETQLGEIARALEE